jgi:peptide/nickel transport system substrate-binding protein
VSGDREPGAGATSRRKLLLGAGAITFLGAQACSRADSAANRAKSRATDTRAPRRGGLLRISFDQTARGLNPLTHVFVTEFLVGELLFSGLTRLSFDMQPEPDLALSWSPNDRLDVWTFVLRPNVRFHDGSPLTSADVVATIKAILDPATGSPGRSAIGPIVSVEAVDSLTVRLTLSASYADLPAALTHPNVKILRAAHLANDQTALNQAAVGTGPFTLVSFEPAHLIEVKRNPGYFRPGQPYVDRTQILIYPDSTAESSSLLSDGVDLMGRVRATDFAGLAASPGIVGARVASGQFLKLAMRCDQPPFNDVRVRQAMAACIDRQVLLDVLVDGYGSIANDTPISSAFRFFHQTSPKRRDIGRARALMAAAGYPDGVDLTIMTDTRPPFKRDFCVAVREMAKPAGFRIDVKVVPDALYLDQVWLKERFYAGNAEMRQTEDAAFSFLFTSQSPWNESHWHDSKFDDLVMRARSEEDDADRKRLYAAAQTYLSEQTPSIIPIFFDVMSAYRDRVQGFRAHPRGVIFRLESVWLS